MDLHHSTVHKRVPGDYVAQVLSTSCRQSVVDTCRTRVRHVFFVDFCRPKSTKIDQKSTKSCHFVDMKSTKIDQKKTRVVRALFVVLVSVWCRLSTWCRQILVDFCRLFVDFGRFLLILVDFGRLFVDFFVDIMSTQKSVSIWSRFMSSDVVDINSTYTRPKWTSDQHAIDKKRQKPWNFVSTWYRHRFLCRYDVDIKIHDFCRFLSMVCWSDVHFGRVHVNFCRSHVVDMCRTWDRQIIHILSIDVSFWSTSCRLHMFFFLIHFFLWGENFQFLDVCRHGVDSQKDLLIHNEVEKILISKS